MNGGGEDLFRLGDTIELFREIFILCISIGNLVVLTYFFVTDTNRESSVVAVLIVCAFFISVVRLC